MKRYQDIYPGSFRWAGFFITKKIPLPDWFNRSLLPAELLSLSTCLAPTIPDTWCLSWATKSDEKIQKIASHFALAPGPLKQLTEWVSSRFDQTHFGWPNVCLSLDAARELMKMFFAHTPGLILAGLGIDQALAREFLDEQLAAGGKPGVAEAIGLNQPLRPDAKPLGFDVLGYENGGFHSWLCNGFETQVNEKLNIQAQTLGLLKTYGEAERIAEYCNDAANGAEPVHWHPWLVTEIPNG